MALLKHITEHKKEWKVEVKEVKAHGVTNILTKDKEEKEDAVVNTNCVFSESMLDDFILWKCEDLTGEKGLWCVAICVSS